MTSDKLIRRDEIIEITALKKTKVIELISKGKLIKPIYIDGFQEALYSFNELQDWIQEQKNKRECDELEEDK
jgi:prophage regulatory protein